MSRPTIRPSADAAPAPTLRPLILRLFHIFTILSALCSVAANYGSVPHQVAVSGRSARSEHFIVSAPTAEFAQQVCALAEKYRRDLAIEWLGKELPAWRNLCPIRVIVGPRLPAGGATTFTFINGRPGDWDMEIQGSRERILDSVLPHEITHTIMATHFGRPLPRWADEGIATSVEHVSERTKQDKLLIEFLTTRRGIAFNQMFAMKEYPRDILPLYSQGYSLARYLIAKGGKRKFVAYVGDGMAWNNWTAATQKHYGMQSLSELQITWLDWVRQGSPAMTPAMTPDTAIALNDRPASGPEAAPDNAGAAPSGSHGFVPLPPRDAAGRTPAGSAPPTSTATARPAGPSDGWYSRRRDEAAREAAGNSSQSDARQHVGRVQPKRDTIGAR